MWRKYNQYCSHVLLPLRTCSIAYKQAKLSTKTVLTVSNWDKQQENITTAVMSK